MTDDFALDPDLRNALRDEAYRAPVQLTAAAVRSRLDADDAGRRRRRPFLAALGALAGLALVVSIVGLRPAFQRPGGVSPTNASPSAACPESAATKHGSWWVELGGPGAYFNIEPGTLQATEPGARWLIITRFDPDPGSPSTVAIWAERAGSGERVDGSFNSPMDPSAIYRFDEPAPALPGGWYLFEQAIPSTGCWQLTAAIDGRVVGSATIAVPFGRQPSTPDPAAPTPASATGRRVECGRLDEASCSDALAIVRATHQFVVDSAWAIVIDDTCPPTALCDRAFPFDSAVVLVPDPASAAGPLGFLVVGVDGPERVFAVVDPLPEHVIAQIRALGGVTERGYELSCGALERARCAELAYTAVLAAEGQYPTKRVVSLEFTSPEGSHQLLYDDNTGIGVDIN